METRLAAWLAALLVVLALETAMRLRELYTRLEFNTLLRKLPDGETITLAIYLKPGTSPFISTKARDWKQYVIIQAPKRELTAYGDRRCSLHDLKKRVRFTRY